MFHLVIFLAALPFAIVGLLMLFDLAAWFVGTVLPWIIGAVLVALAAWAAVLGLKWAADNPREAIEVAIVGAIVAALSYANWLFARKQAKALAERRATERAAERTEREAAEREAAKREAAERHARAVAKSTPAHVVEPGVISLRNGLTHKNDHFVLGEQSPEQLQALCDHLSESRCLTGYVFPAGATCKEVLAMVEAEIRRGGEAP
jgi:hypothetical protein